MLIKDSLKVFSILNKEKSLPESNAIYGHEIFSVFVNNLNYKYHNTSL